MTLLDKEGDENLGGVESQHDDIYKELQQNKIMIKKLSLLSESGNILLSEFESKSLDEKFDFIVEKATEILDAELCTLWLVEDGYIYIKTSFGIKDELGEPKKIDKQKKLPIKTGQGSGLHGHVALTKEVHNLNRNQIINHHAFGKQGASDFLSTENAYSSLSYPMVDKKNELLGLLVAYNKRDEQGRLLKDTGFSKEFDEPLMKILATKLIIAMKNANLIASKTEIITELMVLEKVQETIAEYLDVDKILESVLEGVVTILGFDFATISKVEQTLNEIKTIRGKNVPQEWIDMAWHSLNSNDIQAWVVRNKQEIKLTGWDDRLDKEIYERFNHRNLVRVYLPIISHDAAYGTLEAGYKKDHREDITEQEIETLRKVVNLAGIGIDQAYTKKEQQK